MIGWSDDGMIGGHGGPPRPSGPRHRRTSSGDEAPRDEEDPKLYAFNKCSWFSPPYFGKKAHAVEHKHGDDCRRQAKKNDEIGEDIHELIRIKKRELATHGQSDPNAGLHLSEHSTDTGARLVRVARNVLWDE